MNFSWIDDGHLAACRGPRTDEDLDFLYDNGVRALIRLAYDEETGITTADVERHGIKDWYEPGKGFTPPGPEQLDRTIPIIPGAIAQGIPVAVSCCAGYGRTGTVIASYLTTTGHQPQDAIEYLIKKRPGASELLRVPGQKEAIIDFHKRHAARKKT
jgi:atypical dual specificity phosphatase